MSTYIVRVHFAVNTESPEKARELVIAALDIDWDFPELESSCVDNVEEIETEEHFR